MLDHKDDFRESHLRHGDFLGAFGVVETAAGILMVQNRRRIGGAEVLTWDLPGGQVEVGEGLSEALRRELAEETGVSVDGDLRFLFVQEGQRTTGGQVDYAWRSFFFEVADFRGEPVAGSEVLAVRWVPRPQIPDLLEAPYHDSFQTWLTEGGSFFVSGWHE